MTPRQKQRLAWWASIKDEYLALEPKVRQPQSLVRLEREIKKLRIAHLAGGKS